MASVIVEDISSASSIKSGKSGNSNKSSGTETQSDDNNSPTNNNSVSSKIGSLFKSNSFRSGSISSTTSGGGSSTNHHRTMSSVVEEDLFGDSANLDTYRQCLQWLQQTCRPVFTKELSQTSSVPVPITADNARNPDMIGGIQQIQVATWKQYHVQVVTMDKWGSPQEVLQEIQALHTLRKCRQVIQLYGYLPNSSSSTTQIPALLLQQPSYGSLRQFLDHHFESLQWPERYKLALDMTLGLRFLISQGVPCTMHSGNVLVDNEGVAVLSGFGIPGGLITSAPCQMTSQPTPASLSVYMAPEKLRGDGAAYSPDWTVYSLGILLWELSSGRMPFEEIIARAENGPRLSKSMEQLTSAIMKGLREETITGTPEIYEQLYKMCWEGDPESRPPLEVIEETLQMLIVVEPMDMLMLPGEDLGMSVTTIVSDSIDGDAISTHAGSNSNRSSSPGPNHVRPFNRPQNLHQAVSVSNRDMTEWYILSGQDLNGYAIVPTYSLECEITPVQTCLGHFLPHSLPILRELMEQDADISLPTGRTNQNCLHVLFDRYIPFKNDNGSGHLFEALDMLLAAGAEVNARDAQGYTPLHILMKNPKISSEDVAEVLSKMVAKGADTSIQAPREGNVLALAAKYLHFEAARAILNTDISASEPASIERAIESCMTMTGRSTDKLVNLRNKTKELLKLWTGSVGAPRREKVVLKILTDSGLLDPTGLRYKINKNKPITTMPSVPQGQLDCANTYYDTFIRKKREMILNNMGGFQGLIR